MRENHSSGSAGASPGNRGRYPEMQMNMDGVNMDGVCPSRLLRAPFRSVPLYHSLSTTLRPRTGAGAVCPE